MGEGDARKSGSERPPSMARGTTRKARVRLPNPAGGEPIAVEVEVPSHLYPDAATVDRVFETARAYAAPAVGLVFFGVAVVATVKEALEKAREKGGKR